MNIPQLPKSLVRSALPQMRTQRQTPDEKNIAQ